MPPALTIQSRVASAEALRRRVLPAAERLTSLGRITAPVRGATLIGDGATALTSIEMIGDDFAFDPGVGVCGKAGQGVPVGIGQPSLKIGGLTVGGTAVQG